MRAINVSTAVFARIWALRQEGEESENEILERVLNRSTSSIKKQKVQSLRDVEEQSGGKQPLWRDDIVTALRSLGGEADLAEIYAAVEKLRAVGGRSLPASTDAVIRRELENNSSDSESYTGHRNLFRSVNGIGGGRWALR